MSGSEDVRAAEETVAAPRSGARRRRDTEERLAREVDVWVATASVEGVAHLVSLSFVWDGRVVLMSTDGDSVSGRNLLRGGVVRLGLGATRDVTMIEGRVRVWDLAALPVERVEGFVARCGFDPREAEEDFRWFEVVPVRVQAWREVEEIAGRELMREGRWLF